MKGYLIDKNGALTLLPEFLSWDVCHGMGEPCDWFEVSFIYYSAQLPKLQSACRFRAVHNNAVVFKGIIDEYSISIDEKGSVVTLSGRSDAALLLDNELPAQEYAQLSNTAAVSAFARAFGISSVVSGSAKTLNSFSVRTGESAWSALKRFCRYAWGTVLWGDRIFEKCGIGRDEGGDGGKTLEIRGKRRLSARDRGANYQQS